MKLKRVLKPCNATLALFTAAVVAIGLAGCGGSDQSGGPSGTAAAAQHVDLTEFPQTDGSKTLIDLQREVGAAQDANLLPAANDFVAGRPNRLPFGLFAEDRSPVWGPTALYIADGTDSPAIGPIRADGHTFEIPPSHRSSTTRADVESVGNGYYAATLPPHKPGKIGVLALTRRGDGFEAAAVALTLSRSDPTVAPGERVPAIDTPTGSTPAELDAIDTRDPHDGMHEVSLKDALAQHRPIVLLFATPKLCASRVCAPVTDVAEWVRHEYGGRVIFIHNEIYRGNDLNKGFRPEVKAFNLPSEPFTFVIAPNGRVAEQLQGPFDAGELRAAIARAGRS
jgi:hypothetical protein